MKTEYYQEYISIFLEEAEEQLQVMGREIMHLEQFGSSELVIQNLFRAAHTLKGSSAAMGFHELKDLTHAVEHILDLVRGNQINITSPLINLLFKSLDHLQHLKQHCSSNEGGVEDITEIVTELKQFADQATVGKATVIQAGAFAKRTFYLDDNEHIRLREIRASGLQLVDVYVQIKPDCIMKLVRAFVILNYLYSWGDVVVSTPSLQDADLVLDDAACPDELRFILAISSDVEADFSKLQDELLKLLEVVAASVVVLPTTFMDIEEVEEDKVEEAASLPMAEQDAGLKSYRSNSKQPLSSIRVDVERLDHMMNLVGELVIDQTRMVQVGKVLNHRYSLDESVDELGNVSDHVSRIIAELQDSVMKVRMLPIGQLFHRFQRMVRDLSISTNKEIEISMHGEETELDRTVIEEIGDPFIHLIRNAVDHGIEPAEVRMKAGKSAKGSLQILAEHVQNQVILTVQDDGAGIDHP